MHFQNIGLTFLGWGKSGSSLRRRPVAENGILPVGCLG